MYSGTKPFDKNTQWYWASAGKSLTATLVGIAQTEGKLNIEKPTAAYLGAGWTSMSTEKEQLITVKNQLTMTTGLEFIGTDLNYPSPLALHIKKMLGSNGITTMRLIPFWKRW